MSDAKKPKFKITIGSPKNIESILKEGEDKYIFQYKRKLPSNR